MNIIFQCLYEECYCCIRKKKIQEYDEIIFPQNFIPVPGLCYKNLDVKPTWTGEFIFEGKKYNVSRAYHPDYDLDGVLKNTSASWLEALNFRIENKDRKVKMGNGFAKLSKIKEQLPN